MISILGIAAPAFPAAVASSETGALSPQLFAELASGVALVRSSACGGGAIDEGSGFLVGARVVMTAGHVIAGACRVRVLVNGRWIKARGWTSWSTNGRHDLEAADVATIMLSHAASGHLFGIRSWSAAIGAPLAAIGHPLGQGTSLTQGTVTAKGKRRGVPMLEVHLLDAQGGSGSPLLDDHGKVVGILQLGVGEDALLGQVTSDVHLGIDLPSWWPTAKHNLCQRYKTGDIPGCKRPTTTPSPSKSADASGTGTRSNPWRLGTTRGDGNWTLRVDSVNFDAWPIIASTSSYNKPPKPGYVDVLAYLTVANKRQANQVGIWDSNLVLVGVSGVEYRSDSLTANCGIVPEPDSVSVPTAVGTSGTYDDCWQVLKTDVPSLELHNPRWAKGYFALH